MSVELTWDDRGSAVLRLVFFCHADVEGPPVFEGGEMLFDEKDTFSTRLLYKKRKNEKLGRNATFL